MLKTTNFLDASKIIIDIEIILYDNKKIQNAIQKVVEIFYDL